MSDETQNPGADATGDAAAPTTDDAVGGAAVGEDKTIEGGDEYNLPNVIMDTPDGEELHVSTPTGQDDFIVKPSGEIVRKYEGSGWDEYIEGADVPPNAIIYRTASGEEEVHIFSETGQDDAIVKPSGEIVPRVENRWDEYIEKEDVVEDVGEAPDDVAEADGDFFDGTF